MPYYQDLTPTLTPEERFIQDQLQELANGSLVKVEYDIGFLHRLCDAFLSENKRIWIQDKRILHIGDNITIVPFLQFHRTHLEVMKNGDIATFDDHQMAELISFLKA